jgi:hypothetical protein
VGSANLGFHPVCEGVEWVQLTSDFTHFVKVWIWFSWFKVSPSLRSCGIGSADLSFHPVCDGVEWVQLA